MKLCLICVEIFAWNKYGGFGRATRTIGRELAKRDIDVYAVVPRQSGQKSYEELDGIKVYSYPKRNPLASIRLFKKIDPDICHSEEPSLASYLAQVALPDKKHIITFRDTRDFTDWKLEYRDPSVSKLQVASNFIFENNFMVHRAIKKADKLCCASHFVGEKAKMEYKLNASPQHLPTPVKIAMDIKKSPTPLVCYLARWDRRKRPELFFNLAQKFPHVEFVAVGKSRDKKYNDYLKNKYSNIPNLKMEGFINQFESDKTTRLLSKSWILINTASREGLPNAFIEAISCKCAILSHVNPDGFASDFGYHASDENFEKGLEFLLKINIWKSQGEKGYEFVKSKYEMENAINQHLDIYKEILG